MTKTIAMLVLGVLLLASGERYMEWEPDRKLTWDDFGGAPDNASTFKAYTKSKLIASWACEGDIFTFTAIAKFDKAGSWKKDVLTDHLLAHEQLHFDLAELYARKMRKHFSKLLDGCGLTTDEIKEQASAIQTEWEKREKQYDEETEHSKNREEQARWQQMVSSELKLLSKYAD
jgi:hypothetical protein